MFAGIPPTRDELVAALQQVDDLLATEKTWATASAVTKDRKAVHPCSPWAVGWCLLGAVQKVVGPSRIGGRLDINLHQALLHSTHKLYKNVQRLDELNDRGGFDKVKRVIAHAKDAVRNDDYRRF